MNKSNNYLLIIFLFLINTPSPTLSMELIKNNSLKEQPIDINCLPNEIVWLISEHLINKNGTNKKEVFGSLVNFAITCKQYHWFIIKEIYTTTSPELIKLRKSFPPYTSRSNVGKQARYKIRELVGEYNLPNQEDPD